ncbi:hypothetical protein JHK85_054948 [Glycine max]|nr:hypothetical protein JHK86_053992 [Glycine max]KAG4928462.1 hypothetical protein JHK85_054948 [Glycine max]
MQHRYYGKSFPFGGNEEDANANSSTLGYLSSTLLIIDLKKNLSATYSPVIISLNGCFAVLTAWFRMKYPHVAIGALASSAPILQFLDLVSPYTYTDIITQDYKELYKRRCSGILASNGFGYCGHDRLSSTFQFPSSFACFSSEKDVTKNADLDVMALIDNLSVGNEAFTKLYAAASIFYNYSGTAICFGLDNTTDTLERKNLCGKYGNE